MSVPDALRPPPGNARFPLIDALRAVAVLSVVITHASGLTNFNADNVLGALTARLDIGVTIFFLISGFLLHRPFVRAALRGSPAPPTRRFLRRRGLRILPAYWLALTVLAVWPGLVGPLSDDWYAYYGLLQVYSDDWILGGIGPAWSLCIEVTFYAVLPLYAIAVRRLYARRGAGAVRLELGLLAALGLLSLAARTAVHAADDRTLFTFTLPGTFLWFSLGMGLAVASVALEGRERELPSVRVVIDRPWLPWAAATAVFVAMAYGAGLPRTFGAPTSELQFAAEHVLYGTISLLVLLPAVFGDRAGGAPRRLLATPVLAWLGLVSYGIYLWHLPLMGWLLDRGAQDWIPGLGLPSLLLPAASLAIACAAASYYLLERPLMRLKDPPRPPAAPTAGASPRRRPEAAASSAG